MAGSTHSLTLPIVVTTWAKWQKDHPATRVLSPRTGFARDYTPGKPYGPYFASPDPAAFAPERFPVWIWMDDPCFYGFPTYGEPGPKAAQDVGGQLPVGVEAEGLRQGADPGQLESPDGLGRPRG